MKKILLILATALLAACNTRESSSLDGGPTPTQVSSIAYALALSVPSQFDYGSTMRCHGIQAEYQEDGVYLVARVTTAEKTIACEVTIHGESTVLIAGIGECNGINRLITFAQPELPYRFIGFILDSSGIGEVSERIENCH